MELFQPSSLRRTDGSLVHAASSTGLLSTANQAAATRHTPRQINVFGGTTGVGASLFSADPSWTATPSPVAQPPAAAPTSSTPPTGAVAPVSSPSGTTTPATEPAPAPTTTPPTAPASPAPAPAPATPVTPVTPVTPTPPPATQGGYTPAQQTIIDSFSNVKDTASYNTWLTSAKNAGIDTSGVESKYKTTAEEWKTARGGAYKTLDPLAASNVYQQIRGLHDAVKTNLGKEYWTGEGLGSQENNMREFTDYLVNKGGITDMRQLSVKEEPVMARARFHTDGRGKWYREDVSGDDRVTPVRVTDDALIQNLNLQRESLPDQRDEYGHPSRPNSLEADYATGKNKQVLINKDTGKVVSDRMAGDGVFTVGGTNKGEGRVNYQIAMKKQTDPNTGEVSYTPIPVQSYESTSDAGDWAPLLMAASFIPGAAPFVQGINAALSASQGNWLGAITSALGAAPGISEAANLGMTASTANTLSGVSKGLSAVNALDKGDVLGAIAAGSGALGSLNKGLDLGISTDSLNAVKQVGQGAGLINSVNKGDYISAFTQGSNLAGVKDVGGVSVNDIGRGASALKALDENKPLQAISIGSKLFDNDRAY